MKIVHLSPHYFSPDSVIGGGERYAVELAQAMAAEADVTFVSFSQQPRRTRKGPLAVHLLRSWKSPAFLSILSQSDIIHCHQIRYPQTDAALILAKLFRKKIFLTDLGGGVSHVLSDHLPIRPLADGLLLISRYSSQLAEKWAPQMRPDRSEIIYGGVDPSVFCPNPLSKRSTTFLFVGRIVAHKGIEYLIDALPTHAELIIAGRVYDLEYYQFLLRRAAGKSVQFVHDTPDCDIIRMYQKSLAVIQPSVNQNYLGAVTPISELLGLSALEAMACETPVILSDTGSLPELIEDGKHGFIVPSRSPDAIRQKLQFFMNQPQEAQKMGKAARSRVLEQFTWRMTAQRCLELYKNLGMKA